MCGITGIVYTNKYGDRSDIKIMADAIAHRGPDGEGFVAINSRSRTAVPLAGKKTPISLPALEDWSGEADVYLAHRRLSIIDLSPAGHQPMSNADGTLWITFNGEIYNYKTLRNELSEFEFKSNTDTEVLLYAYQKWDRHCLDLLNGMFSFVIYDKKKNVLFGARDRFGVKPFYYVDDISFFAFNSEIKGLVALNSVSRQVNQRVTYSFLSQGNLNFEGETFFKDIKELMPSHCFSYSLEKHTLNIERYYDLEFTDGWQKFDASKEEEYVTEVRKKTFEAIRLRLNSDVTVGSCLSGGMDSTSIVCTISELLKKGGGSSVGNRQSVITACFEDKRIDESLWAKMAAEKAGAEWIPVFSRKNELLDDLQDLIYSQDYPFGSTSIYAQYRVMKAAKENGITVMLDGQGGDELFTGYTPYYPVFYKEARYNGDDDLLKNEYRYINNSPLQKIPRIESNAAFFAKKFAKHVLPDFIQNETRAFLLKIPANCIKIRGKSYTTLPYSTLNQMLFVRMAHGSLRELLKYEDRNSMRFSIETRTPFSDDTDLIEYVFKIPSVYKIHNGWSKYLLRESMKKIIPDEIRLRTDKIGFDTPEYDWIKNIKELVFSTRNTDLGAILDMDKMKKKWDYYCRMQNKVGTTSIWRFINFILWFNRYAVKI